MLMRPKVRTGGAEPYLTTAIDVEALCSSFVRGTTSGDASSPASGLKERVIALERIRDLARAADQGQLAQIQKSAAELGVIDGILALAAGLGPETERALALQTLVGLCSIDVARLLTEPIREPKFRNVVQTTLRVISWKYSHALSAGDGQLGIATLQIVKMVALSWPPAAVRLSVLVSDVVILLRAASDNAVRGGCVALLSVLSCYEVLRDALLGAGAVEPLAAVAEVDSPELFAASACIAVANLVGDEGNHPAIAVAGGIERLVHRLLSLLDASMRGRDFPLGSGAFYESWNVVMAIWHLSMNDNYKRELSDIGTVELLRKPLRQAVQTPWPSGHAKLVRLCIQTVNQLAFDATICARLRDDKVLIKALSEHAAITTVENQEVRAAATRALSMFEDVRDTSVHIAASRHVLISHGGKQGHIVARIGAALQKENYSTWVAGAETHDFKSFEAVDDAAVAALAIDRETGRSEACRMITERAHRGGKDIIPIVLETGVLPTGWLRPFVHGRPLLDFSNCGTDEQFGPVLAELVQLLGRRGIRNKSESSIQGWREDTSMRKLGGREDLSRCDAPVAIRADSPSFTRGLLLENDRYTAPTDNYPADEQVSPDRFRSAVNIPNFPQHVNPPVVSIPAQRQIFSRPTQHVAEWTVTQTSEWFKKTFPFAQQYAENFEKLGIDASTLLILTEQDLKDELHVTSSIHRRAIMEALSRFRGVADDRNLYASPDTKYSSEPDSLHKAESMLLAATEAVASNARTEIETAVKAAAQKAMQDAERRAEARVDQVRMEGEEQVRLAREETVSAVKSLAEAEATLKSRMREEELRLHEEIEKRSSLLMEKADSVARSFSHQVQDIARREYATFIEQAQHGKTIKSFHGETSTPAQPESQTAFKSSVSLRGNFSEWEVQPLEARVDFDKKFQTTMAQQLSAAGVTLSPDQIKIIGHRGGSIVIDYSVITKKQNLELLNSAIQTLTAAAESKEGLKVAGYPVMTDSFSKFEVILSAEDKLKANVVELEAQIESMSVRFDALQAEKKQAILDEGKRVHSELESQVLELQSQVSEHKEALSDREEQISAAEIKITENNAAHDALRQQLVNMTEERDALQELVEENVDEATLREDSAREIVSLKSTIDDLRIKLQATNGENDEGHDEQLQLLREELEQLREENQTIQTQFEKEREEIEEDKANEIEEVKLDMEELQQKVEELEEALQEQIDAKTRLEEECKEQIQDYDEQLSNLEKENEQLKKGMGNGGPEMSEEQVAEIKAEAVSEARASWEAEAGDTKLELEIKTAEQEQLNFDLEEAQEQNIVLEEKIAELEEQLLNVGPNTSAAGMVAEANGEDSGLTVEKKKERKKKKSDKKDKKLAESVRKEGGLPSSKKGYLHIMSNVDGDQKRYARLSANTLTLWKKRKDEKEDYEVKIDLGGAICDVAEDNLQVDDKDGNEYQFVVPEGEEEATVWYESIQRNIELKS